MIAEKLGYKSDHIKCTEDIVQTSIAGVDYVSEWIYRDDESGPFCIESMPPYQLKSLPKFNERKSN